MKNTTVSWNTYAQKYDMLLSYNPFYQELYQRVFRIIKDWEIAPNSLLADYGAGTGNYSLGLAQRFPQAEVLHIDSDAGMNELAAKKRQSIDLNNHIIVSQSIDDVELPNRSLSALISIHALYTFPNPEEALTKMYNSLKPGGKAVLVDAGRVVDILNWQFAISKYLVTYYGFRKTFQIMLEGREVSRQNRFIREMQIDGTFWTHSHEEFCQTVENTGFTIEHSEMCFRGYSDLVIVSKK